jgi:hypothetical protein
VYCGSGVCAAWPCGQWRPVRPDQQGAGQEILRPDITEHEAADVLWLLTSFDSFDLLYTGRGLPVDEVARRLTATAERSLCR